MYGPTCRHKLKPKPRHRLCLTCANEPRLMRCPLCRRTLEPCIPHPSPLDDPTYEYFYIQIYNNQLLTYVNHSTSPDPPTPPAYNVWTQTPDTIGQLWEVHLRKDLPYYAVA